MKRKEIKQKCKDLSELFVEAFHYLYRTQDHIRRFRFSRLTDIYSLVKRLPIKKEKHLKKWFFEKSITYFWSGEELNHYRLFYGEVLNGTDVREAFRKVIGK